MNQFSIYVSVQCILLSKQYFDILVLSISTKSKTKRNWTASYTHWYLFLPKNGRLAHANRLNPRIKMSLPRIRKVYLPKLNLLDQIRLLQKVVDIRHTFQHIVVPKISISHVYPSYLSHKSLFIPVQSPLKRWAWQDLLDKVFHKLDKVFLEHLLSILYWMSWL